MCLALGDFSSRRPFKIYFLFVPENRIRHFIEIVFTGENLHEMSDPVFWGKKNITSMSSVELAQRVVNVKLKEHL